jgi:serine/threonine protein kinase
VADSEQFRQRFIRESRLAASLDHPDILPVYEAGEADGQLFMAMRYVIGSDLKGLLQKQGGGMPVACALRLFGQIRDALNAAHRAGLVHRDVKRSRVHMYRVAPRTPGHRYLSQAPGRLHQRREIDHGEQRCPTGCSGRGDDNPLGVADLLVQPPQGRVGILQPEGVRDRTAEVEPAGAD